MNSLPKRQKWMRLLLMVVGISACMAASAYTDYNPGYNSIKFIPEEGRVEFTLRYFQTWGGSGDGHCGFSIVTVYAGNYTLKVSTYDNGDLWWDGNNSSLVTYRVEQSSRKNMTNA